MKPIRFPESVTWVSLSIKTWGCMHNTVVTATLGCLQLLEILEISWNLKTLLEILEISWNLIDPPGNFCVRCQRSTALVSSHKNMDKYSLQIYTKFIASRCVFFQIPDAPKPVFGRGCAPDPYGGAYDAPPDSYSAGES